MPEMKVILYNSTLALQNQGVWYWGEKKQTKQNKTCVLGKFPELLGRVRPICRLYANNNTQNPHVRLVQSYILRLFAKSGSMYTHRERYYVKMHVSRELKVYQPISFRHTFHSVCSKLSSRTANKLGMYSSTNLTCVHENPSYIAWVYSCYRKLGSTYTDWLADGGHIVKSQRAFDTQNNSSD